MEDKATLDDAEESRRLETLGLLAGGVAHDLNNQLTIILGDLSLALENLDAEHPASCCLHDVELAALRCVEITQRVLGFIRRTPLEIKPVPLGPLLLETERLLNRMVSPAIKVRFQQDPALPPVLAHPMQIQQVLVNLATNACDAMPDGGILGIKAQNGPNYIRISVSDTGVGIAPEIQNRIFDALFTTKAHRGGTGLGLATVLRIVQAHGGSISFCSKPQEGTTFEFTLPVVPYRLVS